MDCKRLADIIEGTYNRHVPEVLCAAMLAGMVNDVRRITKDYVDNMDENAREEIYRILDEQNAKELT